MRPNRDCEMLSLIRSRMLLGPSKASLGTSCRELDRCTLQRLAACGQPAAPHLHSVRACAARSHGSPPYCPIRFQFQHDR